jgi:hypothetical protein
MKNKLFFGVILFVSVWPFVFLGCASIKPVSLETINNYKLLDDTEKFKRFLYFVSRDIVLEYVDMETADAFSAAGLASLSVKTQQDYVQLLSSTTGKCLKVDTDGENYIRLGIEFDLDSGDMLWFYYNFDDDCFYLDYTDPDTNTIEYAGISYNVSYEGISFTGEGGVKAITTRLFASKKAKDYQNMVPLLLYEETGKQTTVVTRRTLGGSRL